MMDEQISSEITAKILKIIEMYGQITFTEFSGELHAMRVVSLWCCFHQLRHEGLISRDTNKKGEIEFSLTDKGHKAFNEFMQNKKSQEYNLCGK